MATLDEILAALRRLSEEANGLRTRLEGTPEISPEHVRGALLITHQQIAALSAMVAQLAAPAQPPNIPPGQMFEMERQAAINRIWTESHLRGADERSKHVIELGLAALRSVFLVNGGAIIALLTFLGTDRAPVNSVMLKTAFQDFGIGLVLALIAMGLGYITQQLFSHSEYDKANAVYIAVIRNEAERPNAGASPFAVVLQVGAFFCAAGSLLFFFLGSFAALDGLFPSL